MADKLTLTIAVSCPDCGGSGNDRCICPGCGNEHETGCEKCGGYGEIFVKKSNLKKLEVNQ